MQYKNYRVLFIMLVLSIFISCKKTPDATPPPPPPPPTVSLEDKIKDSTLLYAREIYLWYKQIPANFDPRAFADPDKIMRAIRQYSTEPLYQTPVDRWSYAMKKVDYNNLSSGISTGDFGIGAGFISNTDLRISSVEKASPAGLAGVRRGWQIIKINGSTNISTSETDINFLNNAIFNSASTSFTFRKPDGTSTDITLSTGSYKTQPIVLDSVYNIGSKKIGYLVFTSFIGDTVQIKSELARVFSRFSTAAINDVIIDLRYNGGGYVSLAERLSNYLAPSSANGSLMMKQEYNDKYPHFNSSVNFAVTSSLNLPRVFFIVGSGTASASEMVINNLLPFMQVKLVGATTHGKPVGFFPIGVGDWYIFPVSSKTVNKDGQSSYYNGFPVDATVRDAIEKDWGDITESRLASAIKFITTGAFRYPADPVYTEQPQITNANATLDKQVFKGAISRMKVLK